MTVKTTTKMCLLLLCVGLMVGCGGGDSPKGALVKGKLMNGSEPVGSDMRNRVVVSIELVKDGKTVGGANTEADGSFMMDGIAAGTYKLVVKKMDTTAMEAAMGGASSSGSRGGGGVDPTTTMKDSDAFKGKFFVETTPVTVTVPDQAEYDAGTIDLSKY